MKENYKGYDITKVETWVKGRGIVVTFSITHLLHPNRRLVAKMAWSARRCVDGVNRGVLSF